MPHRWAQNNPQSNTTDAAARSLCEKLKGRHASIHGRVQRSSGVLLRLLSIHILDLQVCRHAQLRRHTELRNTSGFRRMAGMCVCSCATCCMGQQRGELRKLPRRLPTAEAAQLTLHMTKLPCSLSMVRLPSTANCAGCSLLAKRWATRARRAAPSRVRGCLKASGHLEASSASQQQRTCAACPFQ